MPPKQLASVPEATQPPNPRRRAPPRGRVVAESPGRAAGGGDHGRRSPSDRTRTPRSPRPNLGARSTRPTLAAPATGPTHRVSRSLSVLRAAGASPRAVLSAGRRRGTGSGRCPHGRAHSCARLGWGWPSSGRGCGAGSSLLSREDVGGKRARGGRFLEGRLSRLHGSLSRSRLVAREDLDAAGCHSVRRRGFAPNPGPAALGVRLRGAPRAALGLGSPGCDRRAPWTPGHRPRLSPQRVWGVAQSPRGDAQGLLPQAVGASRESQCFFLLFFYFIIYFLSIAFSCCQRLGR